MCPTFLCSEHKGHTLCPEHMGYICVRVLCPMCFVSLKVVSFWDPDRLSKNLRRLFKILEFLEALEKSSQTGLKPKILFSGYI